MIGAMVFGGVPEERIALNESSFWSGRPHDYDDTNAFQYFPQIRDLVFADKFQEAEKMANDHFYGKPKAQEAYQPIGDLLLSLRLHQLHRLPPRVGHGNGRRQSELSPGRRGDHARGVCFLARPRAGRAHQRGQARVASTLRRKFRGPYLETSVASRDRLVMDGTWKGPFPGPATGMAGLIAHTTGKGLALRGGAGRPSRRRHVRSHQFHASIFTTPTPSLWSWRIATSFVNYHDISGDPAARCKNVLDAVAGKNFATLYQRHVDDFRGLMGRVHLQIGDAAQNEKPTDERLKAVRAGGTDANLEALAFQFGRYLLASSSRVGGQPANLQGIWDEALLPPWGSKYTVNINLQMNYWPAEVCNLTECTPPLFDLIKDLSETGAKTAKTYYNCDGWVVHHNTDLWRGTAPVDAARYGMWPVGGAWLCLHLWEHYQFTGDKDFLRENYPLMRGAAQFLLELLVEDPKHHWLVTPFSMSPEHTYRDAERKHRLLVAGADHGHRPNPRIVRALHRGRKHSGNGQGIWGTPRRHAAETSALPDQQPRLFAGMDRGLDARHRRATTSRPNFPFFPGSTITLRGNPELAGAINKWMETRQPRGGWINAWDTAVWARLERGEKVEQWLQPLVTVPLPIICRTRRNNQSDANFGLTAAIAEALLAKPGRRNFIVACAAARLVQRLGHGIARPRRF